MGSAMTPSTPQARDAPPPGEALSPSWLVRAFGVHPARALGLRLRPEADEADAELERWLLASCLFGGRASIEQARAGLAALDAAGASSAAGAARAGALSLAQVLDGAGHPQPEAAAGLIAGLAAALGERGAGALQAIGRNADGLEELGAQLSALARGFGHARVARFLQPLRDTWPAAQELPLDRNACRAALHLGWLGEEDDDPSGLRARLETEDDAPTLADCEFALAELGRRACRRERPERCPLAERCPQRAQAEN